MVWNMPRMSGFPLSDCGLRRAVVSNLGGQPDLIGA